MIDLPISLNVKPARTYCEEALLRGTWNISSEADGILPTPDEYNPQDDAAEPQTPVQDWYQDVPSSTVDTLYRVRHFSDGAMTCECRGFEFRAKCKHLDTAARMQTELEARTLGELDRDDLDMMSAAVVVTPDVLASLDRQDAAFTAAQAIKARASAAADDLFGDPGIAA